MIYSSDEIKAMVERFHQDGHLLVRGALSHDEVTRLNKAIDEVKRKEEESLSYNLYNCVSRHAEFANLMEHPAILPLVVNMLGFNIQLLISNLTIRLPNPDSAQSKTFDFIDWHQDGPSFGFPVIAGLRPLVYVRVGVILSDLSEPDRGNTKLIPGSHKIPHFKPQHLDVRIENEGEIQVCGKPGDIFLFGQNSWHAGAPNLSSFERRLLIYGYGYMWVRPIDYVRAKPDLLEDASPIRRQLLGEVFETADQLTFENLQANEPLRAIRYHVLGKDLTALPLYPFYSGDK